MALIAGLVLSAHAGAAPEHAVSVRVDATRPVAVTSPRYLSFAIDLALIDGGRWWDAKGTGRGTRGVGNATPVDLGSARLTELTRALGASYLRVGGTEADVAYYDFSLGPSGGPSGALPKGDESRLTAARFAQLADFTARTGNQLIFGLSDGPADRDPKSGQWNPAQAIQLMAYAAAIKAPMAAWELGNEVNAYAFTLGLSHRLSGAQYVRDFARAKEAEFAAGWSVPLTGPASAYWPVLGEPFAFLFGIMKPFVEKARNLDVVTWHFYPTESRRCPVAVRHASAKALVSVKTLDEVGKWAGKLEKLVRKRQPKAELWLGESGSAQCGGEPGVSDRFVSSLWWLDELGQLARHGHKVVVRQSLVGADYGLLAEGTFEPRPDYWASLLWKRVMGEKVLAASLAGRDRPRDLRVYAHCARGGGLALLLINLSRKESRVVGAGEKGVEYDLYAGTAPALTSAEVSINGELPSVASDGRVAALEPARGSGPLTVPPLSYAFVVFPKNEISACR